MKRKELARVKEIIREEQGICEDAILASLLEKIINRIEQEFGKNG
jgi:hypothetical protein